jgi:hypothetical protein
MHTRSTPIPPARVDIKKMNVSLSSLLYSFMLSCLAESGVCPSMLSSNNTSKKYEIQITLLVPKPLKNNEINRKCMF